MIVERIMGLLFNIEAMSINATLSGAEMDAVFSAMGCENIPVYIPADVWQRVSELTAGAERA
ncbi:hypothetical protein Sant_0994 [Sodalis praecaptivus]|uniref:Uncharacterized protein n=1 Tax=Sodalis praecaptivus TaxID=1239307 RepID=W0HV98_9GAMM|nr:hypothetical protein [Sodalis praecaptivus]AHF76068.1 hypothetical protein Sant_0994 [Sodalis praecaptivus]